MFIAEYIKDGYLIRVYSENGKRTVSVFPYGKTAGKPLSDVIPKLQRKEKRDGN